MKHINSIFACLLSVAALATSCVASKEKAPYVPAEVPTGEQVYFSKDTPSEIALAKGATSFSIPIYRSSKELEASDIALKTSGDGLEFFKVNGSVSFKSGETTSSINVDVDADKLGLNNFQTITIEIADAANTTLYGLSTITVSAGVSLPWEKFDDVHVVEGWWGEEFDSVLEYQKISDNQWNFRIVNGWNNKFSDLVFTMDPSTSGASAAVPEGCNPLDVPKQYFGYDYSGYLMPLEEASTPVFAYDWYNFFNTDGGYAGRWPTPIDFYKPNGANYPRSYYDGNGGFFLNMRYYIPGLGGWTPDPFDIEIIGQSFSRKDFTFDVAYDGMRVSTEGEASAVINFSTESTDVTGVRYLIADESTDPMEMLETILAGESSDIEDIQFEGSTEISSLESIEPGTYNLVAVPYGDDEVLQADWALLVDFYYPGLNTEKKPVEATVLLLTPSDVMSPEEMEEYEITDQDGAIGAVIGTDIKSGVHILTYASNFKGRTKEDCQKLIEINGKPFTSTQIEYINDEYGLMTIFGGMPADTEFTWGVVLYNKYGASDCYIPTLKTAEASAAVASKTIATDFQENYIYRDCDLKLNIRNGWGKPSVSLKSVRTRNDKISTEVDNVR